MGFRVYLEEKYPQNPLLPTDPQKKAIHIQVASIASSSIQPLQVPILKLFKDEVSEKIACLKHHIGKCFSAHEELLKGHAGKYATGDAVFLADLFLTPQIHAAINWFGLDMLVSSAIKAERYIQSDTIFPLLSRLNETYSLIPCFLCYQG